MKVYLDLFLAFLKMGFFSIGGGYAMLPLIREEVTKHNWMNANELINFLAVSESTPGSMSVNMASYVGLKVAGFLGQFFAILGVIAPSFIIMLLIAIYFDRFIKNKTISYVLDGLNPIVVGMIGSAIITVGKDVFIPEGEDLVLGIYTIPVSIGIFLMCLILNHFKKSPITIILISAIVGILCGVLINRWGIQLPHFLIDAF